MRYTINIDQEFAVMHDMTLTEVSCLAACFTLPTWSESYYIENKTWYWYSEKKMLEEFPLLFGVAKRVYKNLKILADKGFILLSNIGRKKILCFTEKCVEWNRPKTEIKPENGLHETENGRHETENGRHETENGRHETENGRHETENGLHETENGRHNNNIIDKYTKDNITTDNITTDKDGAKTDFSPEPARTEKRRFSKENGLTPGNLNVRQSTIDKTDAAFEQLIFPVDDVEVKRLYFILCCSPKWRGKTINALQMSLNKMQHYHRDYIKKLIEDSIAGGWQGIVFSDTAQKYKAWLKENGKDVKVDVQYTEEEIWKMFNE